MRLPTRRRPFILGALVVSAIAVFAIGSRSMPLKRPANSFAESRVAMVVSPAMAMNDTGPATLVRAITSVGEKLIRSAELRIQVRDVAAAARGADDVAHARAGLLADSHISLSERAPAEARLVLRVPADDFDAALDGVRRLGTVRSENESAGDVTREIRTSRPGSR